MPKSLEDLLQHKQVSPLSETQKSEIERISALDTTEYSEADVREEIITPVLRMLGYQKGAYSSVDREKHLKFLGTSRYVDYSLKLFEQNHWLVEAKKPTRNRRKFPNKDILQALQYAVHPEIDAALLVLCDGNLFSVFDREFNLSQPILTFNKSELAINFSSLQILLEPWQSWFFQKRRLLKKAKRLLDTEVNITRAEELSAAFDRLVSESRQTIWQNTRDYISSKDNADDWRYHLETCDIFQAVEVHFFDPYKTKIDHTALAANVLGQFDKSPYPVVNRIFPKTARDANMSFWGAALYFMLHAHQEGRNFEYFPSWLAVKGDYAENLEKALE